MSLFPIFVKLAGRSAVVVGAGAIGEGKIRSLLEAGAKVRVIAPEATAAVVEMAAAGEIRWERREYREGDVAGAFIAVAATSAPDVNHSVYAEARERGVLCNAVDDPPYCDFYFPSVVRRGDLQVAISTAGESPALAMQLRKELNEALSQEMGEWVRELGRLRREVLAAEPASEERKLLLHKLAGMPVCGAEACPARQVAREHAAEVKR